MKNKILFLVMFLLNISLYSQVPDNVNLVKKLKTGNNESELGLSKGKFNIRDGLGVGDNYSWNGPSSICFDEKNNLIVFDQINWKISVFDSSFEWKKDIKIRSEKDIIISHLIKAYKSGIVVYCMQESVFFIDWSGQIKWAKRIDEINAEDFLFYYDEDNDLFFHFIEDGICLIVNNDKQIINEEINSYLMNKKITNIYIKEKNIYLNDSVIKLENLRASYLFEKLNDSLYYINNRTRIIIKTLENITNCAFDFSIDETSINRTYFPAVSRNGNIYYLDYSNENNEIYLYCIENTWSPETKKKWEEYCKNNESTNVHLNDVKICTDNLRLRQEEATNSAIITTMQKGTKVKILKLGKAETIDGISSNWVQVEVQSGGKDRDGKEIKAGTIGWCYGGYLE